MRHISEKELDAILKRFRGTKYQPLDGDVVWSINATQNVMEDTLVYGYEWDSEMENSAAYEAGNVFISKKAAEFELERLKVLTELQETTDPYDSEKKNFTITFNERLYELEAIEVINEYSVPILNNLIWHSREKMEKVIQRVGKENIIKYLFRVGYDERQLFLESLREEKRKEIHYLHE